MSRYRRSTNDFGDDLAYREAPNRWDRDRFESFRFAERDRPGETDIRVADRVERRGPGGRFEERDYHEEDRYGQLPSRPRRSDRELFGEQDPRDIAERALAPYKKKPEVERDIVLDVERRRVVRDDYAPPRPGLLRRQSSLDTFDRRPQRRYDEEYRMPPNVDIPLPRRPSMSRRRLREEDFEQFGYPEDYRDVEIVREREVRRRVPSDAKSRKSDRKSRKSARSVTTSTRSSSSSSSSSSTETYRMPSRAGSPGRKLGKKGRTRMPKRLVRKEVVIDLNYPFIEEVSGQQS